MNLKQYQTDAYAFAQYPSDPDSGYLTIAIMGECGEVANVYKKELRLGIPYAYTEQMQDEIGDLWWYINAICTEADSEGRNPVTLETLYKTLTEQETPVEPAYDMWSAIHRLMERAVRLDDANNRYGLSGTLIFCRELLNVILWIMKYYNLSLEAVLEYNLYKLSTRAKNGEIKEHE